MSSFAYVEIRRRRDCRLSSSQEEVDLSHVVTCVEPGRNDVVATRLGDHVYWLSNNTYDAARDLLGASAYRGYEGASFGVAKGVWLVEGEPLSVGPPVGAPRDREYVLIETKWGKENGIDPFVVESDFVFKGFLGKYIEIGRVVKYRYFLAPYKKDGTPLTLSELQKTWLWKNYLSNKSVQQVLRSSSTHAKKEWWHIERMTPKAVKRFKVVWRDVADRFIPAVEATGAVAEHSAHYIAVNTLEEAYYLLAVLLAPQINAVIREISSWVGHVEPNFITYFNIPRYQANCDTHKRLAELGKKIHEEGVNDEIVKIIQTLVKELRCR